MNQHLFILLIGQQSAANLLRKTLKISNFKRSKLFAINSLCEIKRKKYDLIISTLEGGIGELFSIFELFENTPVVYFGDNEPLADQAIQKGAQDFLVKSELTPQSLSRTLTHSLSRGEIVNSLRERAFTDDLTGLYNRRGFFTLANQQMELTKRTGNGFLLFLFDLDYLKQINDKQGHKSGDRALVNLANSLIIAFRSGDIIARIGGDEFAVVALNCQPDGEKDLQNTINQSLEKFKLSCSIGTAYYKGENTSLNELIDVADRELYTMKKKHHTTLLGRDDRI